MKPHMDVAIFGMQRAGTTMLSGLLTYGKCKVFVEPGFGSGRWKSSLTSGLTRWGVKEVNPRRIEPTLMKFTIPKIIVPVRDIRSVAYSKWEWIEVHGQGWSLQKQPALIRDNAKWVTEFVSDEIGSGRVTVVHYEDFVREQAIRADLACWLDWPLLGDPSAPIRKRGQNRGFEVDRHGHTITDRRAGLHQSVCAAARKFVQMIEAECMEYQEMFGFR